MNFEPIGYIESCFKERFGTPRQSSLAPSAQATLRLRPELNLGQGLKGLEGFSHLWLIFVFHQNTNKTVKTTVHPPRLQGEAIGVFATRAPHRPNPIGLSVVKIEKIADNTIVLSGIDVIDGTPVLDIKPYLPDIDAISQAKGGWTESRASKAKLSVIFEAKAQEKLASLKTPEASQQLIEETLALDPRPTFYKGTAENPNPYMTEYGVCLEQYNVVYRVDGEQACVIDIQTMEQARHIPRRR